MILPSPLTLRQIFRSYWWVGAIVALIVTALVLEIVWTAPERSAVETYHELISAANRGDLAAAEKLCSHRYLAEHPLKEAPEGGMIGLPRGIHKNHQAWRHGRNVWFCPTNRIGPIYQFVPERGSYLFDGLAGMLESGNLIVPVDDAAR